MKFCKQCGNEITSKSAKIFCSKSCSAKYNNKNVRRHGKPKVNCVYCDKKLIKTQKKFCSRICQADFYFEKRLFENGVNSLSIDTIKRKIIEWRGYKCEVCGINEWQNKRISLDLHHIDGNSDNNNFENLELLCPNCHSTTDTYKKRNNGNGRYSRKKRYQNDLSY